MPRAPTDAPHEGAAPLDALTEADESFLDELLRRMLDDLAAGRAPSAELLCAGRPHLRARVERLVERARSGANCRPPVRPEFAGFEIVSELGRGGMGCVYLARQKSLGRLVALKVLPPAAGVSPRARRRFLEEAHALARLRDPRIVAVHDVLEDGESLACAMEWVEGQSLAALLAAEKPPIPRICALVSALARALAAVHRSGLVHRDVKPSNVLVRTDGTPVLIDFGLARGDDHERLTTAGEFVGTSGYAAPEQLRGESDLDGRTDVYSLGVTLYEALAARLPYPGKNATAVLASQARAAAAPLRRVAGAASGIPRDLETIVGHAIELERERRYASADELADDLDRLLAFRPILARPPTLLVRARRFARRHRAVLGAMALVAVVALAAGTLGMRSLRDRLEAPARFAEHLRRARLALIDPGFRARAYFETGRGGPVSRAVVRRAATPVAARALDRALREYDAAFREQTPAREVAAERDVVVRVRSAAADLSAPELEQLVAAAPTDEWRSLGLLAALLGWPQVAQRAWAGLDLSPQPDPLVDGLMGQLLLELDEPAAAWPRLVRAFDTWPDASLLATSIADAAIRCGDVHSARRWLARARALPNRTLLSIELRVLAEIWRAEGRVDAAIALLAWSARNGHATPRGATDYVEFLRQRQRFDEALASLLGAGGAAEPNADRAPIVASLLVDAWLARPPRDRWRFAMGVVAGPLGEGDELHERALRFGGPALTTLAEEDGAAQIGRAVASQDLQQAAIRDLRSLAEVVTVNHEIAQLQRGSYARAHGSAAALPERLRRSGNVMACVASSGRWRLALLVGAASLVATASGGSAAGQEVVWSQEGAHAFDRFAASVTVGADYDGDGARDLFVGTHWLVGAVPDGYLSVLSAKTGATIHSLTAEAPGDFFGRYAIDVGDFDGDGGRDFVVGACFHDGPSGSDSGKAYVYSGADGTLIVALDGEKPGDAFGFAAAALDDVTGDGLADFALAAPRAQGGAGRVYYFSGPAGTLLGSQDGGSAGENFGQQLAAPCDLDGDGQRDLLVASLANGAAGRVYVYSGATTALIKSFDGEAAGDSFGRSMNDSAGDADGDGVADLLIGAGLHDGPNGADAGKAYLYSGSTLQFLGAIDGAAAGDGFGFALGSGVSFVGDQDGDGCSELAIGAPFADARGESDRGRLTLWSGRTLRLFSSLRGDEADGWFGSAPVGLDDVDGDGVPDLAAGAGRIDGVAGSDVGKLYVIAGNDLFLDANVDSASAGQTLALTTRAGVPNGATLLAVTELGGVQTFVAIDGVAPLDGNGERTFSAVVPAGLAGLDALFQSFAIGASGRVVDSNEVVVEFS